MVKIELLELTDEIVRYKFFPEDSKEYGVVALHRGTGKRILEKTVDGYGNNYAAHAFRRIEEYEKNDNFSKTDLIAWY